MFRERSREWRKVLVTGNYSVNTNWQHVYVLNITAQADIAGINRGVVEQGKEKKQPVGRK
jgi:hypothetical protein